MKRSLIFIFVQYWCFQVSITLDSPRRWKPLHFLSILVSLTGAVFLILSRGHYTVDVVISYYITTRVFWMYHTLIAHSSLKVSRFAPFRIRCNERKMINICNIFGRIAFLFSLVVRLSLQEVSSSHNHLAKLYWHGIFRFMEGNVHKPLPRK